MVLPTTLTTPLTLLLIAVTTVTAHPHNTGRSTKRSSGCGKALPDGVTAGGKSVNMTIESGGLNRSYLIHVPSSYSKDKPASLILSYHGRTKDAAEQELLSQFSNETYNPDAIAVYPQGVANSKGTRQWLGDPDAPTTINDITFTTDLIAHLSTRYCISPSHIYATGKSNGAGLVGLLACSPTASAQIAAFAPVSGAWYLGVLGAASTSLPACSPARARIPFLEFHGYADTTIAYAGGEDASGRGATIAVPAYMNMWAERDGLDAESNRTTELCGEGSGYPGVVKRSWGGGLVQHYNISNLKHDWPSRAPNDDDGSGKYETCFDATTVIMRFFGEHGL
ncbi:carbohydrate esterase family 1 protein [Saccharata proteae CBS 121410]|uniref:feruloyl esterase n=1 Tax=Saccharata proteae CBS 121410 TaxID=1314787 RepID=A0A9P4LUA8_9PEZI|nr:carbohydrate esterase family 1 protein [Saccharata proteae CBS 121410]